VTQTQIVLYVQKKNIRSFSEIIHVLKINRGCKCKNSIAIDYGIFTIRRLCLLKLIIITLLILYIIDIILKNECTTQFKYIYFILNR